MRRISKKASVECLKVFYPVIQKEIAVLSERNNFAGIMQMAVDCLKILLQQSKIQSLTRNIKRINWIYRRANPYVRYIIENLFVRSFESIKKKSNTQQWKFIYQKIPSDFQCIYTEQITKDQQLKNKL